MLLISPNFDIKSIIYPNFGQGHFPKNAGKNTVDLPNVIYPMFSPVRASVFCNSEGVSL